MHEVPRSLDFSTDVDNQPDILEELLLEEVPIVTPQADMTVLRGVCRTTGTELTCAKTGNVSLRKLPRKH